MDADEHAPGSIEDSKVVLNQYVVHPVVSLRAALTKSYAERANLRSLRRQMALSSPSERPLVVRPLARIL